MKIVIDIPEDMYNDANILMAKDLPELRKIIANGIPVKEPAGEEHTWFDDCYPCTNCIRYDCDDCEYNHKGDEE